MSSRVILAAVMVAAACMIRPLYSIAGSGPDDARRIALGGTLYRQHCAQCHGVNLEGQPDWRRRKPDGKLPGPPHDESGHTWHHPTDQLFRITKLGMRPPIAPAGYQSDMSGFAGVLTDEEIAAVLAFIKSTWSPRIGARHDRIDRAHMESK